MLKKVLLISFVLCAWIGNTNSAPNFPFPQQAKYANGILPAGVDHKHVQKVYDVWLKGYYEENGSQARVKFDSAYETVSEGIGYGMIIMAYMDNEKNNTQGKFDKLWSYYKAHSSGGLMDWKINGFGGVVGSGSATDADLDAAVGLLMADKQWGGNYKSEATTLIGNIGSKDVSGDNFKGGSNWTAYNPSYLSTVATQLFANLGGGNWTTVQNNCYTLLKNAQDKSSAKLWPNWCSLSGSPGGGVGDYQEIYGFDACRTPWRLGWAYVWYGHTQAKTLCSNVVGWFKTKTSDTPGLIGQKYNLDGTINTNAGGNSDNIPTYLGPLTIAGMVDAQFQTWVDKGYTRMRAFGEKDNNYYNECLELLSMLLLTGNMPDMTKATPKSSATLTVNVSPAGAGTVTKSPEKASYAINDAVTLTTTTSDAARYTFLGWTGDYEGTATTANIKVYCDMTITALYKDSKASDMVDDCEDGDNQTFLKSFWFSYTDVKDTGKSTITPYLTDSTHVVPNVMTAGGYNSSKNAMKVTYTLDKGKFKYQPFVGVGFTLDPDRKSIDVSSSTGFRFVYKGTFGTKDTCSLKLECDAITELGANYSYTLVPSTSWKEVQVLWADFLQPLWAIKPTPLDKTRVPKIQWQIQGNTGTSGELWLDDIHLIGYNIPTAAQGPQSVAAPRFDGKLSCIQSGKNLLVNYSIKKDSHIKLGLFDMNGRLVANLAQQFQLAGSHAMKINLHDRTFANSGYLVSLSTGEGTFSRPLMMNR